MCDESFVVCEAGWGGLLDIGDSLFSDDWGSGRCLSDFEWLTW